MSVIWTNGVNKGILSPTDFVRITSTKYYLFKFNEKKIILK